MDARQLEELYRLYGYAVHRRCLAVLGNEADAQEATQEVFVKAMEKGIGPHPWAWLCAVATHHSIDGLRRRRRVGLQLVEASVQRQGLDDRIFVQQVLAQADALTAEIGVLHFFDGFTQEEVADQLKLSRRTVGKKLKLLREFINPSERDVR